MSEETLDPAIAALENRSRALFEDSVAGLDMRTRSRLTQARHAALAAAGASARRPWLMRTPFWASAAGVTAAAVLGVALWFGGPSQHGQMPAAEAQSKFEDLDIIAASDESSGDAMDMLQDDIDFYAWADKTASNEPTA
jgi:negative regulator of sigma E activity